MSGSSDEETSDTDRDGYRGGGGGGSDADDEDDDDDEIGKVEQRRRSCGGVRKAKKVVLYQFAKAKSKIARIRSRKSGVAWNGRSTGSGKSISGGDGRGCRFCFSRPKVLESPNESPTSDPNDPKFTHVMLRTLIEKNDFYSAECNTHLS